MSEPGGRGSWTLLTGHGHVLVEIARNPCSRIRDLSAAADLADLAERTVQVIVADLEAAGYIARTRTGRRTRYTVNPDSLFRRPAQKGHRVGPSSPCWPPAATAPDPPVHASETPAAMTPATPWNGRPGGGTGRGSGPAAAPLPAPPRCQPGTIRLGNPATQLRGNRRAAPLARL